MFGKKTQYVKRMFLMSLALVMLSAALPQPLHAQEGTESPVILAHHAELLFPAVARFFLRLDTAPEDIAGLRLELRQDEALVWRDTVDVETALLETTAFAELRHVLSLAELDNMPAFFSPVQYRWTVELSDGTVAAEGEFTFAQSGVEWRHEGEPPLRFTLFDEDLNVAIARRDVLPAYELMQSVTGESPDFHWLVLPRDYTFCEEGETEPVITAPTGEVYPCSERDALGLYADDGYRSFYRQMPGLIPFENELIDAMFPVFYSPYWRDADVPGWFASGLAQLHHVTSNPLALLVTQEQARRDRLFTGEALVDPPDDPDNAENWRHQTYTMVLFLADAWGAEAPFALAADAAVDGDFEPALQTLTGGAMADFFAAWERWLFSEAAEHAVTWTPYQPPTPTPLPTATATLTATPTLEPSVTPTPSVTPSPTSIVAQVVTALPTYTPTRPSTVVPTNTPRPPGSINQPSADSGGSGICPAALPGLFLPFVAFVTVQRRKKRP